MEVEIVLTDNLNKFCCEENQRNGKVLGRRYWLREFFLTRE